MKTLLRAVLLVAVLAAFAFSVARGQAPNCDAELLTPNPKTSPQQYMLSGAACPASGLLAVYTVGAVDGDDRPVPIPPNDNFVFSAGPRAVGAKAGLWWPVDRLPGR